ncbi:VCBS domain-containing protein [Bradyrhizobium sp. ISRA442]|uniref:VCBS domain-containing protein n=1 Tax=Bradyrhizobium sp. ISRA442 TaxID=2866197 RepID=UPI00311B3668
MNYYAGKLDAALSLDGQGLHPPADVHVDSFTAKSHGHVPDGAVVVPDPNLIFHGEFRRAGVDLVLSNDGHEFVVHDYFKGDKRAAIASPDGAHLTGDIVSALTGHVQYAQAAAGAAGAEVIGHVTKLAGSATAVRNGVSIILNNGDNVEKGDVVSTGADSTLGITFIDGTVFGLSSNARMVLNDMVYDPNGSNNSSLLSLVAGTITFVAGETAKHGDMKVDTPVATMGIRGTAVLTQINFIVPPGGGDPQPQANFQVLVEPNGTTGSYILFDKITLLPIATVNQAGQMIQISGGNVSVSNALLSPDVQKLITDVFTLKFTDNNSNTKLTTNFTDTITQTSDGLVIKTAAGFVAIPTFVNLNQLGPTPQAPADHTTSNDRIPGPPEARSLNLDGNVQTAFLLTERADKTGDATDLDTVSGRITFLDFNRGDQPTVQVDLAPNYVYKNAGQQDVTATLTALQQQDIAATQIKIAVVPDANNHNNGSAVWTYSIPDKSFDFLAGGETLTLTYVVRVDNNFAPNNETTYIPITITITGTNDKPTIATSGGTVIEQIGTGNTVLDTITGTVTFTDVDLTDRPIVSAAISSTQPFKYLDAQGHDVTSSLTPEQLAAIAAVEVPLTVVQAAGNANNGTAKWTYSVADHFFDFLADGETLVLNYVVQVDDGHGGVVSTPVTVSINGADVNIEGTNDVPTIVDQSTTATGALTEDAATTLAANGTITFRDPDLTDTHTASFVLKSSDAHANLPGYSETAPLSEIGTFALTAVTEHPGVSTIGSVGWSFTLDDSNPVLQSLAEGQTITQVYTVTVDDHHGGTVSQDVTVTITGTNDAPTITSSAAAATGKVTEDTGLTLSIDGTLTIQDLDLIDTHTAQVAFKSSTSNAHLPGFGDGTDHIGTFTIDSSVTEVNTDTDNGASLGWHFTLDDSNPVLQSLAEGQTITQVYTVTFTDDHNATVSQDVTVTITGVNDAPTITSGAAAAAGDVTEDTGLTLSLDGTLAIQDLDLIDTHTATSTFKSSSVSSALPGFDSSSHIGTFTIDPSVTELTTDTDNGATLGWHFTLDDSDQTLQSLAAGQTITQVYTVTFDDHHGGTVSQDVTITINGVNDAPTLDNASLPSVAGNESNPGGEAISVLFAGKFHDVDNGASLKAVAVTSDAATSAQGVWQYEVGGQWVDIGSVDDAHALVLSPDTLIRFVPADGYTGTPGALGVHALDDTYTGGVTSPATIDLTSTGTGGPTPVSHDVTTISTEVTAPVGGPVIDTESFQVWHSNETNTDLITNLRVVDTDSGASTDTFTVTALTAHEGSSVDVDPTPRSLDDINLAFENGITYNPGVPAPLDDEITLTVTDSAGHSDVVHFIFNEAGDTSNGITLQGTDGKDVIFATETNDTLIGGAGKDQFVFSPNASGADGQHIINDFATGVDKIDLRQFSDVSSINDLVITQQSDGTGTLVTWTQQVTPFESAPVTEHESILLKSVVAANLKASDFIFHIT